jgi:hypothetical protein
MLAVGPQEQSTGSDTSSRGARSRARRHAKTARRKRRSAFRKALDSLVRGLAIVVVLVLALTPAFLWGSSRYFFEFTGGEVVAYQGLPYAPLGFELNQEWRRPGVTESEIKDPYRKPIENHKLYTKDEAEKVLGDLGN